MRRGGSIHKDARQPFDMQCLRRSRRILGSQSLDPCPNFVGHRVLPNAREHSPKFWIRLCTLLDFLDELLTMLSQKMLDRPRGNVANLIIRGV